MTNSSPSRVTSVPLNFPMRTLSPFFTSRGISFSPSNRPLPTAITSASNYLGAKYLIDCILYVTLEPCVMCAAALKWAQLDRIVFGATDPREGFSRLDHSILHVKTEVVPGILEEPSAQLLKQFFQKRRDLKN